MVFQGSWGFNHCLINKMVLRTTVHKEDDGESAGFVLLTTACHLAGRKLRKELDLASSNRKAQGAHVHVFPPQLSKFLRFGGSFWPEPVLGTRTLRLRTEKSDRPDRTIGKLPKITFCKFAYLILLRISI